jgi:uncharacterized protein (TIGR02594 family)
MNFPSHMLIAFKELGITEFAGHADNPRISEYLSVVNMPGKDEIYWCAAYASWVLKKDGYVFTWQPDAKSFLKFGIHTTLPYFGNIAVFDRGKESWMGHVGFIVDDSINYIMLLSGNVRNRVCVEPYPKSKLVDIRDPRGERRIIVHN